MLSAKISVRDMPTLDIEGQLIIVDNRDGLTKYRVRCPSHHKRSQASDRRRSERESGLVALAGGPLQGGRVPVRRRRHRLPMASHCRSLFPCVSSIHFSPLAILSMYFNFNFDAIPLIF